MRGRTLFIADTSVHETPAPEVLADIAVQTAAKARQMGHEPRVAFLSFSNFGNPLFEKAQRIRDAVAVMDARKDIDFEYDGEMTADADMPPNVVGLDSRSSMFGHPRGGRPVRRVDRKVCS